MAATENSQRNIFAILEDFLIKVASLDIFEVLIFNYKLKDEFISGLSSDFIPIINELFFEVQELLADYKRKPNSLEMKPRELSLYPSLPENIESRNVPEGEKLVKEDVSDGSVVNPVDIIPQSVLSEMPLFSPKIIAEDNLDVDATDSLWNSDSKTSGIIPNQIHLPDISNHSSESDNCSSFQCLSCHKFFTYDSKLGSNVCPWCKKEVSKNSSHAESSYSNNVDITKLSQEYPLDFRHSTEIGSLIEDALHVPKGGGLRVDYKVANESCAITDSSELEGCQSIERNGSHSEGKSVFNLNNDVCLEKTVIKEAYSNPKDAGNKILNVKSEGDSIPEINDASGENGNEVSRTHKRTLCCDSNEDLCEKACGKEEEALCSVPENCNIQSKEDFSECALVNSVIINSVGMKSPLPKIRAKKKIKRKDRMETFSKEISEKVDGESEPRGEQDVAVSDSIKEDCWELGKMKCLGSNITPFICCKDCFFVFKDWEFYHKHVCNSNPTEAQTSGNEELMQEISDISSRNGKENEKAESGKLRESLTALGKQNGSCDSSDDHMDLKAKMFAENDTPDVTCSRKLGSVVTDYEALSEIHRFVCSICLEEYRSLNRIMYHLPRCVCGPYKCELCPLEYASRRELNLHKKKNHRDTQSFICDECGVKFKFRTSLQKHKVNRHERMVDKEAYSCPHCSLTFPKKIYLTNHCIKVHCLERKFLCQVCGKKFLNQNSLNSHLNYHTEEAKNRFACVHCSKTFLRKEKLLYHMRIHTGERPYECKSCGKMFISKARLTEHLWRHGGKKRYSCPHCPKKYAGRWDLKVHVRKMHGKTLSSTDGHSTEESSVSVPESLKVDKEVPSLASNETAPMLVVERVQEKNVVTTICDSNGLVGHFSTVTAQDRTTLPSGMLMSLPNSVDHSLPQVDLQSSQLIQLSSPSNVSSVPIQIQVSSATHDLEVASHPNIIFTSGLYLS